MGKYAIALIITGLLLSACCPTVSVNPLSSPAELDERLEGAWKYDPDEGEEVYLHIGKASESTMAALIVEHKEEGEFEITKIPFFLTSTGMSNYMNIRIEDLEKDISDDCKGYVFVKYVFVNNNNLNFYSIDDEPVISAIKENKLKGKILYNKKKVSEGEKSDGLKSMKTIDCVIITDSSENMIDFFDSDKNNKIFSNELKFVRIK
jgi:hypothetical protein